MQDWTIINQILNVYETASGQQLNRDKTVWFFSSNTNPATKHYLMDITGLTVSNNLDKYLGLPSLVGRSRVAAFRGIVDRVATKLHNWKNKFLSQAGKLVKAVLQVITTYCMSVFLLPDSLSKKLNSVFASFWWGHLYNFFQNTLEELGSVKLS